MTYVPDALEALDTEPSLGQRAARLGRVLCLAGAALGALGLLGWTVRIPFLTTIVPGAPRMKANTALSLLLLGATAAIRRRESPPRARRMLTDGVAAIVLAIGLGTLVEYASGNDLGIDQVFVHADPGCFPGRPSPPTALALSLLAGALLTFDARSRARARPSEWMILIAGFLGFAALVGFSFGAGPLYRLRNALVTGVAFPTAMGLLLTSAGMFLERPAAGIAQLATSSGPGGALLRALVLPGLVLPVLLAFGLSRLFRAAGIQDVALLFATLVAATTVVGLALLVSSAAPLDHAHRALVASRARTSELVQHAPDGIFVADLDGRYTDVNRAGCELLGFSRDEIVGKAIADLIPREDVARLAASKRRLLNCGPEVSEWRLRRKDGTYVAVELNAKILRDGRWQAFVREITERKRAEAALRASEAKYVGLVSIAADAIISTNDRQQIVIFNQGAEQIFGWSAAEVLGKPLDLLIPQRSRERHRQHMRDFAAQPETARTMDGRGEISGLRKNGEEFPAEAAISKLRVEEGLIFTAVLRDVTEQRRAVHARDDVLGIVAHDLRNPLGGIAMQAQMILRRISERDGGTRRAAEGIEKAAARMNRLIDDLLDVTRIEGGHLAIAPGRQATAKLVSEVVEAQRAFAIAARLELRFEPAPEVPDVLADRDRLVRVFENLIGNAIKFAPPGGRVIVGAAPQGTDVLFWVGDDGPGIPGDAVTHLFDRFWQVNRADRRGAGLGLTIVKGIVEAHGGRIWVETAPGTGTTFFFTIPAA